MRWRRSPSDTQRTSNRLARPRTAVSCCATCALPHPWMPRIRASSSGVAAPDRDRCPLTNGDTTELSCETQVVDHRRGRRKRLSCDTQNGRTLIHPAHTDAGRRGRFDLLDRSACRLRRRRVSPLLPCTAGLGPALHNARARLHVPSSIQLVTWFARRRGAGWSLLYVLISCAMTFFAQSYLSTL